MRLLVRAYNDGNAFRYAFDNDEIMHDRGLPIMDKAVSCRFPVVG